MTPPTRFLIETFDPAAPKTRVPVGRGATLDEVRARYACLVAKGDGWAFEIVDTAAGYAKVPA